MIEKEAFIAALLPICDTVCEYDRTRGKLRVRKTDLASGLEDKWYTVEELRDIFRDNGGVSAEKSVWMRYLSSENLRSFFYEKERNESFRLRFRQGSVAAGSMTSASTGSATMCWSSPGGTPRSRR